MPILEPILETFKKCKAMQLGGAVFLLTTNNASFKIRKSLFVENYHFYFDQNPFSNAGPSSGIQKEK